MLPLLAHEVRPYLLCGGAVLEKQQSRRRHEANGFAFVPHTWPPARLGHRTDRGGSCSTDARSERAKRVVHRRFFTTLLCRILNIRFRTESFRGKKADESS
jgi:hypothetical protein